MVFQMPEHYSQGEAAAPNGGTETSVSLVADPEPDLCTVPNEWHGNEHRSDRSAADDAVASVMSESNERGRDGVARRSRRLSRGVAGERCARGADWSARTGLRASFLWPLLCETSFRSGRAEVFRN